jgi:hypothetical protein
MTSHDLAEYRAFYALEDGEAEAMKQTHILSVLAAQLFNRWRGKDAPPAKPADFVPLPWWQRPPPKSKAERRREVAKKVRAVFSLLKKPAS